MTRYSDEYPEISRPFHLSLGTIRPISDDAWDFYLASVFGHVPTLESILVRNPTIDATIHYEFPLIMAVRQGRVDAVRFLLNATDGGIDNEHATQDNVWFSRCIDAAKARGFLEIQAMLKECRAKAEAHAASDDAHKTDETLRPALESADVAALKQLLDNQPELTDVSRDDQMQMLLWAYGVQNVDDAVICEMLGLLIDHGIDPNCGPLVHFASERNSVPIVRLLLEKGADPNTVVDSCSNCMWIARFGNPDNYHEVHKVLQSYGGRIMLHDEDEVPPVGELLAADPESRDAFYPTGELLWAILKQDDVLELDKFVELYGTEQIERMSPGGWYDPRSVAMIDRLVEHGMNVNQRDWRGRTMIFLADTDRIGEYLRHRADLNVVEFMECSTRLGYAAFHNNLEMAEFLLENGADPNLPAEHEWARPLAQAQKKNHSEMVALLQK